MRSLLEIVAADHYALRMVIILQQAGGDSYTLCKFRQGIQ